MTKDEREQDKSKELMKFSMMKGGPLYLNPRSTKCQTQGQLRSETELKKNQPPINNNNKHKHHHTQPPQTTKKTPKPTQM